LKQALAQILKPKLYNRRNQKTQKEYALRKNDVLVTITASRKKGELEYKVDCSSSITNEEFEYYLGEIIKGICEWKPAVCEENIRSHSGTIRQRKKVKSKLA
jgi:hypothetical protein